MLLLLIERWICKKASATTVLLCPCVLFLFLTGSNSTKNVTQGAICVTTVLPITPSEFLTSFQASHRRET